MNSPKEKIKKTVTVECKPCRLTSEVQPEKVPFPCKLCRGLMYPVRTWEIKK
jgi:hypothetical protein